MGWFNDDSDEAQAYNQVCVHPINIRAASLCRYLRWSMLLTRQSSPMNSLLLLHRTRYVSQAVAPYKC